MIAPMKKVTLFVPAKLQRIAVSRLAHLGILHVDAKQLQKGSTAEITHRRKECRQALYILDAEGTHIRRNKKKTRSHPSREVHETGEKYAEHINMLSRQIDTLQSERGHLSHEREQCALWGDFDPAEIEVLYDIGIKVRFFVVPKKHYMAIRNTPQAAHVFPVGKAFGSVYCVHVRLKEERRFKRFDAYESAVPSVQLSQIDARIDEIEKEIAQCRANIRTCYPYRDVVAYSVERLDEVYQYSTMRRSMHREHEVAYITGFIPAAAVKKLKETARQCGWGLLIDNPAEDDPIPTKIERAPLVRIVQPLFSMLGVIPGYKEFDIGVPFLVFFSIFFGLIIGDGGYGLLLVGVISLVLIYRLIRRRPIGNGVWLMMVLGTCTVIWGAVTGNWFGYEPLQQHPFLAPLIIDNLNAFDPSVFPFVQWLCFMLGVVHLTIARGWRFLKEVRERPRIRAIAQLGWIAVLWGLYSLVILLILGMYDFFRINRLEWCIIGGSILIILFENQEGKFWRGVWKGIQSLFITFLDVISSFGDIISYVRLFAVGLATVEIARSFFAIAANISGSIWALAAGVAVLLIGHSLNMVMGGLSIIVHGIRLKMLEFSNHLGVTWSGIEYRPFSLNNNLKRKRSA